MNILKQNKKNINLSIFLFPIILGIISFSIYVLFCINEFNYIISNSYKISANQLAKSLYLLKLLLQKTQILFKLLTMKN